jgi:hypothetical protein
MAQPTARGPVEIKGVTTRVSTTADRACPSCLHRIDIGVRYERVARLDGTIESYHVRCFEDEFGERGLYGE